MKKFITNHKFGITLLFALIIGALLIRLSGGCPIYRIFHIECLLCGMFHACLSAMQFDLNRAFSFHPMFWSVPILALYIVFEGKLFKNKTVNILVIILLAIGFLANWVLKYKNIIFS